MHVSHPDAIQFIHRKNELEKAHKLINNGGKVLKHLLNAVESTLPPGDQGILRFGLGEHVEVGECCRSRLRNSGATS